MAIEFLDKESENIEKDVLNDESALKKTHMIEYNQCLINGISYIFQPYYKAEQSTTEYKIKSPLEYLTLDANSEIIYQNMIKSILEKHTVFGVKEFEQIEEYIIDESSPFFSILPQNTELYRARKIKVTDINNGSSGIVISQNQISGYNEENSRESPIIWSGAGRNNIAGQSYLYVADSEKTACAEIKTILRSLISVAEFSLTKELRIIDFSKDVTFSDVSSKKFGMGIGAFFTRLMMSFSTPVENEDEYLATQIIADYIRKTGIDGIAYRSFYTGGINYTIFNSHPNTIKFVKSKVVIHQYSNSSFWDFSNKKALLSYPEYMEYDEKTASQMIDRLSQLKG